MKEKINNQTYSIFKNASKTYFYSSIFFTKDVKKDVFDFYAFVRLADDFVDKNPQDITGYYSFKNYFYEQLVTYEKYKNISYKKLIDKNVKVQNINELNKLVINNFIDVIIKRDIDIDWIESFFESMQMDIVNKNGKAREYKDINDTLNYIYGSAEIIGLVMCKILNLPKESYNSAMHLGRAMQYANFIRDIDEDILLKRCYFAKSELDKYSLKNLKKYDSSTFDINFSLFINAQIKYFNDWQIIAETGFKYIPKRYLVPIKTASDMYKWTTKKIAKNPLIVYEKKVKPSVFLLLTTIVKNFILIYIFNKKY